MRKNWFEEHARSTAALLALVALLLLATLDLVAGAWCIVPVKGRRSGLWHHDLKPRLVGFDSWGGRPYRVVTNSLGFKDDSPREVPLAADRHRVLLLGDSYTEGVGLPFAETFASVFWDEIGRERVEVLNGGVVSHSPRLSRLKLAHLLDRRGSRSTR